MEDGSLKPAPFRRRIILIKRALQMKYVMLVFLSVLVTITVVSLDLYYILGKLFIRQYGDQNLLPLIQGATRLLLVHLSIYSVIVIFISVFISHKFAGPLFRLERVSESIASGDLTVKATFRQGDELFETAEYINQMIETLRQKLLREKNLSDRISQKLGDLSGALRSGSLTPKEASAQLDEVLIEVRHIASDFRLKENPGLK